VLANDLAGVFHAGGPRRLSLYQIAQIINRVGGYDPALLQGIPRAQAGPIPPRAGNVSMDSSKLCAAVGLRPEWIPGRWTRPWCPTDSDWHRHRPVDQEHSPRQLLPNAHDESRAGAARPDWPRRSPRCRSAASPGRPSNNSAAPPPGHRGRLPRGLRIGRLWRGRVNKLVGGWGIAKRWPRRRSRQALRD